MNQKKYKKNFNMGFFTKIINFVKSFAYCVGYGGGGTCGYPRMFHGSERKIC